MADSPHGSRRRFLQRALLAAGGLALGACDDGASRSQQVKDILGSAEPLNSKLQRALAGRKGLAREYDEKDLSPAFRANGSTNPQDADYRELARSDFADWSLNIKGMVLNPHKLTLAELRDMPSRTQITRHDCVEGWSCIGKWTGARLSVVLDRARVAFGARYVVFHCADTLGSAKYYESIDLADAYHEQSILAYDMNDAPLTVPHGAPLRVRLERMLGYKQAKYIMQIEITDTLHQFGMGKGGYWEDRGYEWYGGI